MFRENKMSTQLQYFDLSSTKKLDGVSINDDNTPLLLLTHDNKSSQLPPISTTNVVHNSGNVSKISPNIKESLINFNSDPPSDMDMTNTDITSRNLIITKTYMNNKREMDYSKDLPVSDPYGYGYIPSLNEVRTNDAKEIQNQESALFTLGAVTGVSLIVLGLLISSTSTSNT